MNTLFIQKKEASQNKDSTKSNSLLSDNRSMNNPFLSNHIKSNPFLGEKAKQKNPFISLPDSPDNALSSQVIQAKLFAPIQKEDDNKNAVPSPDKEASELPPVALPSLSGGLLPSFNVE